METRCSNGSFNGMHKPYSAIKQVECDSQPQHSSYGASFVKLLGPDFSKQLQIPYEFAMMFNGYVPHRFIIESAMTKKCWRVEVEKEEDGTIYIREGWADFVEAHSLKVGNVLLFEYEEQSIFQVKIYDRNGCQKTVVDAHGAKHKPAKIIDYEEKEEREFLEREPKKFRISRPCQQEESEALEREPGKFRISRPRQQEESEALEREPEKLRISRPRQQEESEALEREPEKIIRPRQQKTKRLFKRKYGRGKYKRKPTVPKDYTRTAKVSITGNKVGFSAQIHGSKKHQFVQLTVPKAVSLEKNLASKDELILQDTMGNQRPVKLTHRTDGRAILSHGWNEFFKANEGAAGDTLKLEFLSDGLVQVRVIKASRVVQNSEEAMSQDEENITPNMESDVDELDACTANVNLAKASINTKRRGRGCSSEFSKSSFSFLWRPATTGLYLHIPKAIVEGQDMMNKDQVVLRDEGGKCWPLEVSTRRDGRVAFTKGWIEFWKGHDIQAGDSLDFEFVSEYLIQVKISRGMTRVETVAALRAAIEPKTAMTRAETVAALSEAINCS